MHTMRTAVQNYYKIKDFEYFYDKKKVKFGQVLTKCVSLRLGTNK